MGEDKERRICGKKRVINKTEVEKADVQVDESAGRLRGKKKKRADGAWKKKRVRGGKKNKKRMPLHAASVSISYKHTHTHPQLQYRPFNHSRGRLSI